MTLTEEEAREVYCTGCQENVKARLTDGSETYPHRPDLHSLPFWKCDVCGNFVGCHHKTKDRTRPLGCIPTPELKKARQHVHKILDPLWKSGRMGRREVYDHLTEKMGWKYHTANIRSVEEAREVYHHVQELAKKP